MYSVGTRAFWPPEDLARKGGARDGAVVTALASHRCGAGSNPGFDVICGLSLLLVLSFATRGFTLRNPVSPSSQKPTFPNSNSTRNQVAKNHFVDVLPPNHYLFILFYLLIYSLLITITWDKYQLLICLFFLVCISNLPSHTFTDFP